jgi:hypothetical protein
MKNMTQNIIWMMDETIANAHPRDWDQVRELEREMIDIVGNKDFNHQIVDPIDCLRTLVPQLEGQDVTTIVDLAGWLAPAMQELFPQASVIDRFSLSRVRVVSSPELKTTGYAVSMNEDEIEAEKSKHDMSHVLFIDDTSFSGWTSRKAMDSWEVAPEDATHAFLIANSGPLGEDPGAVPLLESMGSKVVFDFALQTPRDDGWHLKDLHQNPKLDQAFILSLLFQESVQRGGSDSMFTNEFFKHATVLETLFPQHVTTEGIALLANDGKFILRNGELPSDHEIHARNPFLWASPYFQAHVDMKKTFQNRDDVLSLLCELQLLTSDPEGKIEASRELRREVAEMRRPTTVEGQFFNRRERL